MSRRAPIIPRRYRAVVWAVAGLALILFGLVLTSVPRWAAMAGAYINLNAASLAAVALSLQALIFIVTALYAGAQVDVTRKTAARNNTLKLVFDEHADRTVAKQRIMYRKVRDDRNDHLEKYANLEDYRAREREDWKQLRRRNRSKCGWRKHWRRLERRWQEKRGAIAAVLNRYEAFAIGINAEAIDEPMYRRWWRTQLLYDWHKLRPLILRLQKDNPNAYIEFQALSEKWQKEDTIARREALDI